MNNKIFIQMAAYRDPQLIPTITDLVKRAANPENLVVCIGWQHGDELTLEELTRVTGELKPAQFKIIQVDWKASKGACWMRHAIQQHYTNEEYTLQLDSHHRFVEGWDTICKEMLKQCVDKGSQKPVLTAYIPSYDPDNDPAGRVNVPWRLDFDKFAPEGCIFTLPGYIDNYRELTSPIRNRFYSAHFCFAPGSMCTEVQHDPNLYFHGEEISIAARLYTHGYDLYCPHKVVAWHEYTRKGRTKHWDDHNDKKVVEKPWYDRNTESHARTRVLLGQEPGNIDFGKYGFGKVRSLRDYELYAGVNFKLRSVQPYTDKHHEPPNPTVYATEQQWLNSFKVRQVIHCTIPVASIDFNKQYKFWYFGVHDSNGVELYRQDIQKSEIEHFKNQFSGRDIKFQRDIILSGKAATYTVWPFSDSWDNKITLPAG